MNNNENPVVGHTKVFISYAHESMDLTERVLLLSHRLRIDGFDCSIDQYEDSPDIGWPRWMDKQIRDSDFVIIICTREYLNRLQNFEMDGGSGVKWESNLIFQHLYDSNSKNTKFIPVVFYEEDIQFIPKPLKGSTFYRLDEDFEYRLLYMRLRGIKNIEKPEIRPLNPTPFKEDYQKVVGKNIIIKEDWDNADWQGVSFLWIIGVDVPILGLVFKSQELGRKIFNDWKSRFGREDLHDSVHLSVVMHKGDKSENRYLVIIGTNYEIEKAKLEKDQDKTVILASHRSIDVENIDGYNGWNQFRNDFRRNGFFVLCPVVGDVSKGDLTPISDCEIIKRHITITTESELEENSHEKYILDGTRKRKQDRQKGSNE